MFGVAEKPDRGRRAPGGTPPAGLTKLGVLMARIAKTARSEYSPRGGEHGRFLPTFGERAPSCAHSSARRAVSGSVAAAMACSAIVLP